MGIVNVTPDSFSDGGLYVDADAAIKHAKQLVADGADIIDVGGESTRPGAEPVEVNDEIERVIPVIEALAEDIEVVISVDTTKSAVARHAVGAGAKIINDVSGLRFDPAMVDVAAETGAGIVLMHMKGEPRSMQDAPSYDDVVAEVHSSLIDWAERTVRSGVSASCIAIDPGIGFGKSPEHNLSLLKNLRMFTDGEYPVVVGTSRKSFIGHLLGGGPSERLEGTAATVAWASAEGARVLRVHDVREMARVVTMVEAIKRG